VRAALSLPQDKRKKVTAVHKANVLRQTDGVFMDAVRNVAAQYPDIAIEDANIDAMACGCSEPAHYGVIVTPTVR